MTKISNKKLITILLFVGALTLSFYGMVVAFRLSTATDLAEIIGFSQMIANLTFGASILSLSVMASLISDMN